MEEFEKFIRKQILIKIDKKISDIEVELKEYENFISNSNVNYESPEIVSLMEYANHLAQQLELERSYKELFK